MDVTQKVPVLDLGPGYEAQKSEIQGAIQKVLESGQFIMGPDVRAFEEEAAAYLGAKYAIGVNSGTDALVLGLRALGIGAGDEVITTPFTFFATAESIGQVGARPVFVDIDETTLNIDPDQIERAITPATKAILPVHLYGRPANMARIMEIAKRHGLYVLEDCAQSFGARCPNLKKFTGTIGEIGAFSFFPSKTLGAFGDGGLITTDNDELAARMRALRVHGSKRKYFNEELGYNSRLDTIQAAILRVKLRRIDTANEGRRRAAQVYGQLLGSLDCVEVPEVTEGHVFHQYTIKMNAHRDAVHTLLAEKGISTMVYYPVPVHRLPLYLREAPSLPIAERAAGAVLSLPIWPEIDDSTIKHVSSALKSVIAGLR